MSQSEIVNRRKFEMLLDVKDEIIRKNAPDKSFAKGLILLQFLAQSETTRGVTELAIALDLTKSNVHRLLQTLQAFGFVTKDDSNRYGPSLRYWELGYEVWARSRVGQAALADADNLAQQTGCLVHVTVANGDDLILFERIGMPIAHPMRRIWPMGARVPIWRLIRGWSDYVAFQVAFIAALHRQEFDRRADELRSYLADTEVSFDSLVERVRFAREHGYSRNMGDGLEDVRGTASVFLGENGMPLGVLSTISDKDKVSDDHLLRIGQLNKLYAYSISNSLGYRDAT